MPKIEIIIDDGVDPVKLAEFLATISDIYSELSGGDELVIVQPEETYGAYGWKFLKQVD